MHSLKIGFIGGGNMCLALIQGLIAFGHNPKNIYVSDKNQDKILKLQEKFKVKITQKNSQVVNNADLLVLAVKPQSMQRVIQTIKPEINQKPKQIIMSIAAGISIDKYEVWINSTQPIVRLMPNTPVAKRKGVCAIFANKFIKEEEKTIINYFAEAVGISLWLKEEKQLEILTAISGSGPAYYFFFTELLAKQAANLGIDKDITDKIAAQTFIGAASLLEDNTQDFRELRAQVTSRRGTTEAALENLKNGNLENLISEAIIAAINRIQELNKEIT